MSMFKRYKGSYEAEEINRPPYTVDSPISSRRFEERHAPTPRMPLTEAEKPEDETVVETQPLALPPANEPETTVGEKVRIKGTLQFEHFLRIDGHFEGELLSDGKLVVGPTGVVKADIAMKEAIIEGEVEGDLLVERVELRRRAQIKGNITAGAISVDEGVIINGQVSISQSP